VTSQIDPRGSFTPGSDREADDKVPDSSGRGFVPSLRRAEQTLMPAFSFTGLKTRLRDRVDSTARGTDVPAGIERGDDLSGTGSRERGRMRRRLRELRRLREAQLLELGALVLEAHRHDRDDSPVIKHKAAEAAAIDAEARALAEALDTDAGLDTVVAAGIAGPCPTCGTLASTAARFCSTCGTPLDGRPGAAPRTDATPAPAAALEPEPAATEPPPLAQDPATEVIEA
jgi:hypothetical protein